MIKNIGNELNKITLDKRGVLYNLIKSYDSEVCDFLYSFDKAIQIADDILDHKLNTNYMLLVLTEFDKAMSILSKHQGLYETIKERYQALLQGEYEDLRFIPKSRSNEEELLFWEKRGNRASMVFGCLCSLDKTFDTKENWQWIKDCQFKGLIRNDCGDILSGMFEDFVQCRRNYVALTTFDQDIYFDWRNKKDNLIEKAKHVYNKVIFYEPKDERLKAVYQEYLSLEGRNYGFL